MRTKLHIIYLLLVACGLGASMVGCDVHEWPKEQEPPVASEDSASLTLRISVDMTWQIMRTRAPQYDTRYIVELHHDDMNSNKLGTLYKRYMLTDHNDVEDGKILLNNIRVPFDAYEVVVWIDQVNRDDASDLFYNTANLEHILVLDPTKQKTNFDWSKDAFESHMAFDLTPLRGTTNTHYDATAQMKRPLCAYRIIATDVKEFENMTDVKATTVRAHVDYNLFVPTGYNACMTTPLDYDDGLLYDWQATYYPGNDAEAIIAAGILPCQDDTYYIINFTIRMADGTVLHTLNGLDVPVRRNHITEIRDAYLTTSFGGTGSTGNGQHVGIDDSFDDENVIIIGN